jgi:hypothetical protein
MTIQTGLISERLALGQGHPGRSAGRPESHHGQSGREKHAAGRQQTVADPT